MAATMVNLYMCYYCKDCDAYVGCHQNTRRPLGTMANKELRELRKKAHAIIDPIWNSGCVPRSWVYQKLNDFFNKEFHIGESTVEDCQAIIEFEDRIFEED